MRSRTCAPRAPHFPPSLGLIRSSWGTRNSFPLRGRRRCRKKSLERVLFFDRLEACKVLLCSPSVDLSGPQWGSRSTLAFLVIQCELAFINNFLFVEAARRQSWRELPHMSNKSLELLSFRSHKTFIYGSCACGLSSSNHANHKYVSLTAFIKTLYCKQILYVCHYVILLYWVVRVWWCEMYYCGIQVWLFL